MTRTVAPIPEDEAVKSSLARKMVQWVLAYRDSSVPSRARTASAWSAMPRALSTNSADSARLLDCGHRNGRAGQLPDRAELADDERSRARECLRSNAVAGKDSPENPRAVSRAELRWPHPYSPRASEDTRCSQRSDHATLDAERESRGHSMRRGASSLQAPRSSRAREQYQEHRARVHRRYQERPVTHHSPVQLPSCAPR